MKNIQHLISYKKGYIDFCCQMPPFPKLISPHKWFSTIFMEILIFSKNLLIIRYLVPSPDKKDSYQIFTKCANRVNVKIHHSSVRLHVSSQTTVQQKYSVVFFTLTACNYSDCQNKWRCRRQIGELKI